MLESLLSLKERLQGAAHGGQSCLVDTFAQASGLSAATVYKKLAEVGYSSGRKARSDAGSTRLSKETLEFIAAAKVEGIRMNGKATLPTSVAMNIAAINGLEINVSESRMQGLLRQHGMQASQMREARNTQQLRSEHPNHVHQVDPSLCLLIYMGGKQKMIRDDELYKNKLDKVAKVKLKVWRYVRYDHFSGTIDVRYYEGAGESQALLFEFLLYTWQQQGKRLSHGLPRLLLWDKGSANQAHGIRNWLDAMGLQHEAHTAGHAWVKGGVEVSNNIVETHFESRLRFEPVDSVEQLNASAERWARDYNANAIELIDSRVERPGGRYNRDDLWHQISAEQLIACPDRKVCQWFLSGREITRKVKDLRISFAHPELDRPGQYDLSGWAKELYAGQEVRVTPLLLSGGAVRVAIERLGRDTLLVEVRPEADFDAAGRPMSATVFGDRSSMPHDASVTTAKQLAEVAYGEGTGLGDAEDLRRKNARPFGHLNDGKGIVAHSHLGEAELPQRLPRAAQELESAAVVALRSQTAELPPLNYTQAALRLRGLLDRAISREEAQWLKQRYADGVPEEQIETLARMLRGELAIDTAAATGTNDSSPAAAGATGLRRVK